MSNISERQLVNISHTSTVPATVLQDREAFGKAALGLEHIGQFAGALHESGLVVAR